MCIQQQVQKMNYRMVKSVTRVNVYYLYQVFSDDHFGISYDQPSMALITINTDQN